MNIKELKPCPFCDGTALAIKNQAQVSCLRCFATVPAKNEGYITSVDSAIDRWSTRATTAREKAIVDMLPEIKGALIGYGILLDDWNLGDATQHPDDIFKKLEQWENN